MKMVSMEIIWKKNTKGICKQNVIFILRTTVMSLSDVKYDVDINFMYCLYTSETKKYLMRAWCILLWGVHAKGRPGSVMVFEGG